MDNFEKIKTVTEQLDSLNKTLENSIKYQIVLILAFYIYVIKGKNEIDITFFQDIKISLEAFMLILPLSLLYFISKMALTTMLFIETADTYFKDINKFSDDAEEYMYLRSLRPRTIFISIPLTIYSLNVSPLSGHFNRVISIIIYILPGISMAIISYSIIVYQSIYIAIIYSIITAISFVFLFFEYYNGVVTKNYKFLLYATYISFISSFIFLFMYR